MAEYKNVENIRNLFDEEFKKTRKLIQKGESHLDNLAEGFLEADRVIRKIPTADVVEVVRCKDCKHYTNIDTYRNPPRLDFHWCNKLGNITKENDYCSYGERRRENDDRSEN